MAEKALEKKDKGKNDDIVVKCQPHVSRIIYKSENIEIAQPYGSCGNNHECSGQKPWTELPIA